MSEFPESPEKTPYERSVDNFFGMLRNSSVSQSGIKIAVAGLLDHATSPVVDRQKYLDNWAERYEFDIDGILVDAGGPAEIDENGRAYEDDNDYILVQKIRLLSDIAAFVVGSEYSTLSETQKGGFLDRVDTYLDRHWPEFDDKALARSLRYAVGEAMAPYVALDAERAGMGDRREDRLARGTFVLRALDRRGLVRNDQRRGLARTLRGVGRN